MPETRRHIDVQGQVQGVGFRPFVYRLAHECHLTGFVANDSHGAQVEIEGDSADIVAFERRFRRELPPLAHIDRLTCMPRPARHEGAFLIQDSVPLLDQNAHITPDAATCRDCLDELFDPTDRRHLYPFINCTNCGPRLSIIQSIPYDRDKTTMRKFRMCRDCHHEYDDPANRRFHAQPNACPDCGPRVSLVDPTGRSLPGLPFETVADLLRNHAIIAVKGIGGFHLACRADADFAVRKLRRRKHRESKPLAVMVADLAQARALAHVNKEEASLLSGPEAPVVLLTERADSPLSAHVSDGSPFVGVMLAYSPPHHLLFAEGLGPLVMTSANPSDEPLTHENDEALRRLRGIADAFLLHDRDIERPIDDSVVRIVRQGPYPIRRARGYVPRPVHVPIAAPEPILAVGPELKSTVCFLNKDQAVLSQHLGDLQSAVTYRHFLRTIEHFGDLLQCKPKIIAHDMHPLYMSTQYARSETAKRIPVQHHHAHVIACAAENGISAPVIGLACDGTGFGTDRAIWGGELLLAEPHRFERLGHIRYFPLPGGDQAALHPWRSAASLLRETFGQGWKDHGFEMLHRIPHDEIQVVEQMLETATNCVMTSSLGRLFDGVAAILGLCDHNRHEAEAAMCLETQADGIEASPYAIDWLRCETKLILDPRPLIRAMIIDVRNAVSVSLIAARFHETLADGLVRLAVCAAERTGIQSIALSGGCFMNHRLLESVMAGLVSNSLNPIWHHLVPANDGGVSLGQAVIAAAILKRKTQCA